MSEIELIFGLHTVNAVLQIQHERISELYVLRERHDLRLQAIISQAEQHHVLLKQVPKQELDQMLPNVQHQGVIAKCHKLRTYGEHDIEKLLERINEPPFLLILDGVQDPHNLGACLRSANAAGVHMVIAPQDRAVGLTPIARKVACGAAEITPFIQVTNLARTLRLLKELGIWLFGTADNAPKTLYQTELSGALALILGAEDKGLRRLTRELCDGLVSIPMHGSVSSLNVSVATGICLFEALRQRNLAGNKVL